MLKRYFLHVLILAIFLALGSALTTFLYAGFTLQSVMNATGMAFAFSWPLFILAPIYIEFMIYRGKK